jgi:hypothetical protein
MLLCLDGHELMSGLLMNLCLWWPEIRYVLARNLCLCWLGTYVSVGQELMFVLASNSLCICVGNVCYISLEMSQVYVKHFCHILLQKWTKFLSNIFVIYCSRNTRLLQLWYMFSSSQIVHDTTPVANTLKIMPYTKDSSWNIDSLQQHQLILAHITNSSCSIDSPSTHWWDGIHLTTASTCSLKQHQLILQQTQPRTSLHTPSTPVWPP